MRVDYELERLSNLGANWDAQGAKCIDHDTIKAASVFAKRLPEDLISAPAVVPMAKGNLQFEWHDGCRSLEFEFEGTDTLHYLKWDTKAGVEEEGRFPLDELDRALTLIRWFIHLRA